MALGLLFFASPGFAGERVAIIVTNEAYRHLRPLSQPNDDGDRIETAVRTMGFDRVLRFRDRTAVNVASQLEQLSSELGPGRPDLVVFYYSGHGGAAEVRGDNYLLFGDADVTNGRWADAGALKLSDVIATIALSKPLAVVLAIDACRDVLPGGRIGGGASTGAPSDVGKGFGLQAEPSLPTFVSFATRPGETAGDNSTYSSILAEEMIIRGSDVDTVFARVRQRVATSTNFAQVPHNENGLNERAWFQPRYPLAARTLSDVAQTPPQGLESLRHYLARDGSGLYLETGRGSSAFSVRRVDAEGNEQWTISNLGLELPANAIAERAYFLDSGDVIVGGHLEGGDHNPAFFVSISPAGFGRNAIRLHGPADGDRLRVEEITADASGNIWAILAINGNRQIGAIRLAPDLSESTFSLQYEVASSIGSIDISDIWAMDEATAVSHNVDRLGGSAGPVVIAVGSLAPAFDRMGSLLVVGPERFAPMGSYGVTGDQIVFSWIGKRYCCQLAGSIQRRGKGQLLFLPANAFGIPSISLLTTFNPEGETNCYVDDAAEAEWNKVVAVATCYRTGGGMKAYLAVVDLLNAAVLDIEPLCPDACAAQHILRQDDGRYVLSILNVPSTAREGLMGDRPVQALRVRTIEIAPTAGS